MQANFVYTETYELIPHYPFTRQLNSTRRLRVHLESGLSDAHMHVLSFYPVQVPEIKKMAQTLHVQFL